MQRYFVHLKNSAYTPKDAAVLLARARELADDEKAIVRDSRVSKKYIEFDTSIPDGVDISGLVGRLEKISPLASYEHIVERHVEKGEAIKRAIELFNDEKYWGTHEALEAVWKETPSGQERDLLNGVILVAAAFVHDEKDEREICMSILRRARKKLEGATGKYHGIDMDRFVERVQEILNTGIIERFTI
ncbi:hypothetical protein NTE_01394 [Candidatus Nitrososphaera evergladensis SR1]|uniref:DUF309 domain-containing protein n=1 Tax=Candidatus Nitrososphaera evergladensis SR1 TaxID=1459636 RepID=A0A075MPH9_9ARCH|nr:DUF309 domain-containing protein [Candidatus Nitrososphaera evergladensis]AIF83461.1 hypothetical protein NTE_01394 [Candidatus Nitrososphaera evergladensis SR1]